ncbi:MAG: TIR domain-containing protein [Ruminococcaceae bacterium]|nr:TIR domain-containing protein [Oscillospiraceae bacterium]
MASTTKSLEELKRDIPGYIDLRTNFEAYTGDEPYLFISYSHRDTDKVYPTLDKLNEKKYRIWYDESCETGNDFRDELRNKIEKCAGVILFVSEASMNSPFCGMEILCAKENNKRIYPVYLGENVEVPPAFQIFLANLHHSTITDEKKMMASLLRDLPAEAMDRLTMNEAKDHLEKCEDNGEIISVPEGIKTIGANAFGGRTRFKNISLPETLTVIGDEAFRACSNLQKIDIPANTVRIGNSAFRDCVKLKSLTIKNSLIKIGERAFENCPELSNIELPDGLTEIYASVFSGCKNLSHIDLPANLTVIGENAFADCVKIEDIVLPDTIVKIDDLVFSGCAKLKNVSLPEGLKKIGKAAFKNCVSLTTMRIPASVVFLSTDLFRGCDSLKSIIVNPKNRYYKSEPNKRDGSDHVLFNKNKSMIIAYPANSREVQYDVPDSVTVISDWTFSECNKLNRISIPDSVCEIGEGAFSNCKLLDELTIPDSVERIDDCAFRGCENLERILIPSSVTELGWGLFDGCKESLVVYCDEGSAIHAYCERNRICNDRIPNMETD